MSLIEKARKGRRAALLGRYRRSMSVRPTVVFTPYQ